ncbi:TPA: ANR family transcriptional regulator [Vibrio harveyi]
MKAVNYLWLAEHAAELERNGQYKDAAFNWTCASMQQTSNENCHWAQARADFCHEQLRRESLEGVPCH